MRFHQTFAFSIALVAGLTVASCAIPQPAFECNALPPFWGFYTLEEGSGNGACAELPGDSITMQRYLAPAATEARLAILPYRVGGLRSVVRECTVDDCASRTGDDGKMVYVDPSDPTFKLESAVGVFESLLPNDKGVCALKDISEAVQNYPEVTDSYDAGLDDGGVVAQTDVYPALSLRYVWDNVRIISTAQFPGTLFEGHVTITEDGCTAKYKVYGVHPIVDCDTDEDCDPNPNPDAGRFVGSGLSADYSPRCIPYPAGTVDEARHNPKAAGVCGPAADKTFDALTQ